MATPIVNPNPYSPILVDYNSTEVQDNQDNKDNKDNEELKLQHRAMQLALTRRKRDSGTNEGFNFSKNSAGALLVDSTGKVIAESTGLSLAERGHAEIEALTNLLNSFGKQLTVQRNACKNDEEFIKKNQPLLIQNGYRVVLFTERAPCLRPKGCDYLLRIMHENGVKLSIYHAIPRVASNSACSSFDQETATLALLLPQAIANFNGISPPPPRLSKCIQATIQYDPERGSPEKIVFLESPIEYTKAMKLSACLIMHIPGPTKLLTGPPNNGRYEYAMARGRSAALKESRQQQGMPSSTSTNVEAEPLQSTLASSLTQERLEPSKILSPSIPGPVSIADLSQQQQRQSENLVERLGEEGDLIQYQILGGILWFTKEQGKLIEDNINSDRPALTGIHGNFLAKPPPQQPKSAQIQPQQEEKLIKGQPPTSPTPVLPTKPVSAKPPSIPAKDSTSVARPPALSKSTLSAPTKTSSTVSTPPNFTSLPLSSSKPSPSVPTPTTSTSFTHSSPGSAPTAKPLMAVPQSTSPNTSGASTTSTNPLTKEHQPLMLISTEAQATKHPPRASTQDTTSIAVESTPQIETTPDNPESSSSRKKAKKRGGKH